MPTREEKRQRVEALYDRLTRARGVVLVEFRGLTVAQQTKLRRDLKQAGVEFTVVKNTLARIAAHRAGIESLDPYLQGPTAMAFGYDDPVAPVRELVRALRELRDNLSLKAALVEGRVFGPEEARALAELPPREQLLAQVAGGLKAPLTGLVWSLSGLLRGFVYALDALRRQREQQAA